MWREMRIFADKQTINQVKSNSITEATLSTVVCGQSGSGPIKIICVADFSSHYFKEISSLSKSVEEHLNKDTRLDINKPTEKRPALDKVLNEITKTRSKHNKHQNEQEDSFKQKTDDDFPLLGLVTNKATGMYSIKGKPILFRSRAKSAIDITIRNLGEFSNFLNQGHFQRQHISSLLSQCFDPSFTFNAIYHKQENSEVHIHHNAHDLSDKEGTLPSPQ